MHAARMAAPRAAAHAATVCCSDMYLILRNVIIKTLKCDLLTPCNPFATGLRTHPFHRMPPCHAGRGAVFVTVGQ